MSKDRGANPIQCKPKPSHCFEDISQDEWKKTFFFLDAERRRRCEFYCFHPGQPLTEMEVKGMSELTEERAHFLNLFRKDEGMFVSPRAGSLILGN